VLTAAITALIGGILAFFGVEPGPYLVGVAIGVKVIIVGLVAIFGARWAQKRAARAKQAAAAAPPADLTGPP
jgi:hypothetical protein